MIPKPLDLIKMKYIIFRFKLIKFAHAGGPKKIFSPRFRPNRAQIWNQRRKLTEETTLRFSYIFQKFSKNFSSAHQKKKIFLRQIGVHPSDFFLKSDQKEVIVGIHCSTLWTFCDF